MSNYSTTITRNADSASKLLKAVSNSNRLIILSQLKILGARNVSQLLANMNITQPALSQHLAVMREEGLISSHKKGSAIYYEISENVVIDILEALESHFSTHYR